MNPFYDIPVWYIIPITFVCISYILIGATSILYEPKDRLKHEQKWLNRLSLHGTFFNAFLVLMILVLTSFTVDYYIEMDISSLTTNVTALTCFVAWIWFFKLCIKVIGDIYNLVKGDNNG